MGGERFSRRFGHRPEEHEIRVREDAPEDVRGAILTIAESDLALTPNYLRDVLCSVLRKLPNPRQDILIQHSALPRSFS